MTPSQGRGGLLPRVVVAVLVLPGAAALTLLFANVVLDVLLRTTRGTGIVGTIDIVSTWWMVPLSMAGLGVAQWHGRQIEVVFVVDALPGRLRTVAHVVSLVIIAAFGSLLAWYGLQQALYQAQAGEVTIVGSVPVWPVRFMVPIGFAGLVLAALYDAVRLLRGAPPATGGADAAIGT